MRITDWDDAYAQAIHIKDADRITAGWAERSAAFRTAHSVQVFGIGGSVRPLVDLYRPQRAIQGLTAIVHGGYWMAFSGRDFAHLAAGPMAAGQAVAMISYALAPEERISGITAQVAAALSAVAAEVHGPIRLAGHSAGGHLVSRMVCEDVLPEPVAERISHVLSISGVHDLRPLLRTKMNDTLRLTPAEAAAESPALLVPRDGTRITCVAGTAERPEFRRQSALLANVWRGLGADTRAEELPGENHFSILAGLEHAEGALTRLLLG